MLDEGKIAEIGNHRELLAKQWIYNNLWTAQIKQPAGESALPFGRT